MEGFGEVFTTSNPQVRGDSKADTKIGASYSGHEKLASNVTTTTHWALEWNWQAAVVLRGARSTQGVSALPKAKPGGRPGENVASWS